MILWTELNYQWTGKEALLSSTCVVVTYVMT